MGMGQESSLGLLCEISWKLSLDSWAPAVASPLSISVLGFYDAGTDVQLGHATPRQCCSAAHTPPHCLFGLCNAHGQQLVNTLHLTSICELSFVQSQRDHLMPVAPHTGLAGQ